MHKSTQIRLISLVILLLVAAVGLDRPQAQISTGSGGSGSIAGGSSGPAGIGAPMWARYYGNGADGAGPASGALGVSFKNYTTWTCTGAITMASSQNTVILATGAINLSTGCSITDTTGNTSNADDGGTGGSGGAGAASSAATLNGKWYNTNNDTGQALTLSAAAPLASATIGNDGGAITTINEAGVLFIGPGMGPFSRGGGAGSAGGSSGGAKGNGGNGITIIAPSITIASGVIIDVAGFPGVDAAGNSTGGGGGGGGGAIKMYSQTFTDNGAIYKYGGGPGGGCTAPSIQATGGGCDTAGCGKDAYFTVTGVTSGGLDASKITIANAGTGYKSAPFCKVNAGASGLIGSPACHFTLSTTTIGAVVIDTAGSGAVLSTFTTCNSGGYGAAGYYDQRLIQ